MESTFTINVITQFPDARLSSRRPATVRYRWEYAQTEYWEHERFTLWHAQFDGRHAYIRYLELDAKEAMVLEFEAIRADMHWICQLGQDSIFVQEDREEVQLEVETCRVCYFTPGRFFWRVKKGLNRIYIQQMGSDWIKRYKKIYPNLAPYIQAQEGGMLGCMVSECIKLDARILVQLQYLADTPKQVGMAMDAAIYLPACNIVEISERDLSGTFPLGEPEVVLAKVVYGYIIKQVKLIVLPSISQLAEQLHVDPVYMSRAFKQFFHKKLIDFMIEQKVLEGDRLMKEEGFNVSETADKLGYSSVARFSKQYKKVMGHSLSRR